MRVPDLAALRRTLGTDTESRRAVWLLLIALVAVLAFGFAANKPCLLTGSDGTAWRITLRAQMMDRTPFSQTGIDPYQGNFDAYYPVFREYLLPSALALLVGDAVPGRVVTYTIYAAALLLAAFVFARTIGFDRPTAVLGGFLLPLMSLPSVLHNPGLFYALFSLNPHIAQIAVLSLVVVTCFWALDGSATPWRLLLIPLPCLCLLLAILSLVPYVSLMVPATVLYGGAAFLSARRWRDNWPRLLAGVLMAVVPVALGMLTYLHGLIGYTAYQFFSGEFEQTRGNLLFASTMFTSGPFGRILIPLGVLGAVWMYLSGSARVRLLALTHLIATVGYFIAALVIVLWATRYQGPSPVYFETCFWAYSLLFGAAALVDLVRTGVRALRRHGVALPWLTGREAYLATALVLPLIVLQDGRALLDKRDMCRDFGFSPVSDTAITKVLRPNLALQAGMNFRGLAATIDGINGRSSIDWGALHIFDGSVWRAVGNEHRVAGLWHFQIPTLFQYFSFITPPYYLLLTEFLARPADRQARSVLVLTRIDVPMLRLWGVRYVTTDSDAAVGTELASVALPNHAPLRLIELPHPNLGDYSPTVVQTVPDYHTGLRALHAATFDGSQTVVTDASLPSSLVPASNVSLVYEKDGFHLTADSAGRSILVLPAQYSHCWSATGAGAPTLFRADLMQLGVAFQGRLDAHLVFRFGPIYAGECRIADIADMERLNIRAARDRPPHASP